ncbi:MAG TPA: helix-turn-helix domain-containing protein [Roseiarcus sp.]|nr:helix-turn-helix domain-containing protein [Roseiarcus sp.]
MRPRSWRGISSSRFRLATWRRPPFRSASSSGCFTGRATSPAAYYLDLRFSRARELLRLSPMPITDVALACGFQSGAHFSAGYSRHYGHPPREVRP